LLSVIVRVPEQRLQLVVAKVGEELEIALAVRCFNESSVVLIEIGNEVIVALVPIPAGIERQPEVIIGRRGRCLRTLAVELTIAILIPIGGII
jgi:hypothetical protein